jgi:hypothetical protein
MIYSDHYQALFRYDLKSRRTKLLASMPRPVRLTGCRSDCELGFVDREVIPEPATKLGFQVHAAG